jgi:hypothetical protein
MSIDQLTTPVGHWLVGHPHVMRVLTYLTINMELLVPFMFFVPFFTSFFRIVAIVLLFGMQVGFGVTIRIFIFPLICLCATLPLLPSAFWDRASPAVDVWRRWNARLARWADTGICRWLKRRLPPEDPIVSTPRWVNLTAAFFLAYVVLWNLGTLPDASLGGKLDVPSGLRWMAFAFRIDQHWDMFSPSPLKDDGWYVIPGTLIDGTIVDVFQNGSPLSWEKPELVAYTYKNQRWQKYMMTLWNRDFSAFREYYGKYLCRSWNDKHKGGQQLDHFTIYFMKEDTLSDGEAPPERISLWDHYCFKLPEEDAGP